MRALWILLAALGIWACSEMPTHFLPPEVPLTVQLPILDSLVVLQDLLQDTTQVRVEAGTGNIALALEGTLSPVRLAEELGRVGTLHFEKTFLLNELEGIRRHVEGWEQAVLQLPLRAVNSSLPEPPATAVVPPTGEISVDSTIRLPEDVLAVAYREGSLLLILENRYPVPVTIGAAPGYGQTGMVVRTPGYGEWFFPLTATQSVVPPGERRGGVADPGGRIQIDLAGVVLTRSTELLFTFSSPGSGGQRVSYTAGSLFSVFMQPIGAAVEWMRVLPAAWQVEVVAELTLPHGAELNGGELHTLVGYMELQNGLPIAFRGEWSFPQLQQEGRPVARALAIGALGAVRHEVVLRGSIRLVPEAVDAGVIRVLRLRALLTVESPGEPVLLREEHGIAVRVVVDTLQLGFAWGSRLPVVSFEAEAQSEVWLQGNLGLLSQVELEFAELIVGVEIENTAAVGLQVEGTVEIADRNGVVMARLPVPPNRIQPARWERGSFVGQLSRWELRYTDVRLTARPRLVRFRWTVVPEESGTWAFADTSQIRGTVQLLIPVRVRVEQLRYERTWEWVGGESLRRQGQKVQRAEVVVEARNRFPLSLQLALLFLDSLGIVRVPLEGHLAFGAAPVGATGIAVSEQHTLQRFELRPEHIPAVLQANSVAVELVAWTTAQQYVRIRTSDYIHLRAMVRVELVAP